MAKENKERNTLNSLLLRLSDLSDLSEKPDGYVADSSPLKEFEASIQNLNDSGSEGFKVQVMPYVECWTICSGKWMSKYD